MSRLTEHPAPEDIRFDEKSVAASGYRRVGGRWLVTNDLGYHAQLTPEQFKDYLEGRLPPESPLRADLQSKGLIRTHLDFGGLVEGYRRKNSFLFSPAALHILVTTLRCNHKCLYCHSSVVGMSQTDKDMTLETAQSAVDFIFESPNSHIAIEFQGGEPLVNWPVLQYVVRYARLKNRTAKRELLLCLVSTLSLLDEEKFEFLNREQVGVCSSLDGPAEIHDKNRPYTGGLSHERATYWLKRFLDRRPDAQGRRPYKPGALLTTTRLTLGYSKEIVDEYLALGLPGIFIRPLTPIGFARRSWGKIGYTPQEFLAFYRRTLDYILEINLRGTPFYERMAKTLLVKILNRLDPSFVDLRSPSGAALGVLAYHHDGGIYTGDEARMLAQEGKFQFKIGQLPGAAYNDVISHPLVKAAAVATLLENQPMCSQCAYKPYCGLDPTYNFQTQNTLWGRMPENRRCEILMGLFDIVFEKLQDERFRGVFESWLKS